MAKLYTNKALAKEYFQRFGAGVNFHPARLESARIKGYWDSLYIIYIKNKGNLNGIKMGIGWGRLQTRQLEEVLKELTK